MAEIILPPEENEETPQVPELNVDKPSGNSKVITIEFEAKKTNKVSTKDTNQQLYTTDTDAWFEFKETSLEGANGTYSAVFKNGYDGSIFQRTGDVVNGVVYYKIPQQEIRHAGAWRGQIVYTLSNGDTTSREFGYDVKGHILDGKDVREIVVEDFETLMSQLRNMKDSAEQELAGLVNTANQNETDRQAFFDDLVEDIDELQTNYQELLDTGVLQTNINTKLEALEEEYAPKLTEVTAQLAHTEQEMNDLLETKATKGDIKQLDLDKNFFGLDDTWFSNDFLDDLSNGTISTTYLHPRSVTNEELAFNSVGIETTSFIDAPNVFDGVYHRYKINNGRFQEASTSELPNATIVKLKKNKKYRIAKNESDRFIVGLSTKSTPLVHNDNLNTVKTTNGGSVFEFNSGDNAQAVVYVSFSDETPEMKIVEIDEVQFKGKITSDNIVKSKNLFEGTFIGGNVLGTTEGYQGTPQVQFNNPGQGYIAIIEVEPNNDYHISKTYSNIFRVVESNLYPSHGTPVRVLVNNENDSKNEVTVTTSGTGNYLIVYVSFDYKDTNRPFGKPDFMQVELGENKTTWVTHGYKFSKESKPYNSGDVDIVNPTIAKQEFVKEMNKRANDLMMYDTVFTEASGTDKGNLSNSVDLIRLGYYVLTKPKMLEVWNHLTKEIEIKGKSPRTYTLETTIVDEVLDDSYHVFGGKSGTGRGADNLLNYNLLTFVESINGEWLLGVVLGDNGNQRFLTSKQMYDIAQKTLDNESTEGMPFIGGYGLTVKLPHTNPISYLRKPIEPLFEEGSDTVRYIASITKLMTVAITLDYLDLNEEIEIINSDLVNSADASKFPVGDIVSVNDMIYGTLLESSNTFATALARRTGEEILKTNKL